MIIINNFSEEINENLINKEHSDFPLENPYETPKVTFIKTVDENAKMHSSKDNPTIFDDSPSNGIYIIMI